MATPAVILTSTPTPVLHGVLGAARSLGGLGAEVHIVHPVARTPMSASRHVKAAWMHRIDAASPQPTVDWLQCLSGKIGGRPVLVATDDVAALLVADHAAQLAGAFRLQVPEARLARALADKAALAQLSELHGVATPRTLVPESLDDVLGFADEVGFPVVVKARAPEDLRRGRQHGMPSVALLHTAPDLLAFVRDGGEVRAGVVLQEHIPGGPETVWMFNGYFDRLSRCQHSYTGRKLRQFRPGTGYTSLGICESNGEVERTAVSFLQRLGYRGIVDLGMRFDARSGRYAMLDINPRLGATFRLFVGADGTDVLRAMYGDLTEAPRPPSGTLDGRRWATEPHDAAAALLHHRRGELSVRTWLSSYRGLDETAFWSRDDPRPFVAMLAWSARVGAAGWRGRNGRVGRSSTSATPRQERPSVAAYFSAERSYWSEVYGRPDVDGSTYRTRLDRTLRWLDDVGLPRGARVLDVGCGAGLLALALARRDVEVVALDLSPEMLKDLQARAQSQDPAATVAAVNADVTRLPFGDGTFAATIALGVLPWVDDPTRMLQEVRRVTADDGHILVSTDNRQRVDWTLDPALNLSLRPLRKRVRAGLEQLGASVPPERPAARLYRHAELVSLLRQADLELVRSSPVGFGPFTFFGRPLLPGPLGARLSGRLEHLAITGHPHVQSLASQQLALCQLRLTSHDPVARPDVARR